MRRALGAIVVRRVRLRRRHDVLVGDLRFFLEVLADLLLVQRFLDGRTVAVLGEAGLLERLVPGLVAVVVRLHVVNVLVDFAVLDRDAELARALHDDFLLGQRVDDLRAHAGRRHVVLDEELAPLVFLCQARLLADLLDLICDLLLGNRGTVHGRRRAAARAVAGIRACRKTAQARRHDACNKRRRHKPRLFHETLLIVPLRYRVLLSHSRISRLRGAQYGHFPFTNARNLTGR